MHALIAIMALAAAQPSAGGAETIMHALIAIMALAAAQPSAGDAAPRKDKKAVVCSWEVSKTGSPYKVCATRADREERSWRAQMAVRDMQQRATQTSNL